MQFLLVVGIIVADGRWLPLAVGYRWPLAAAGFWLAAYYWLLVLLQSLPLVVAAAVEQWCWNSCCR